MAQLARREDEDRVGAILSFHRILWHIRDKPFCAGIFGISTFCNCIEGIISNIKGFNYVAFYTKIGFTCYLLFTYGYGYASDYIEKMALSLGLEKLFLLTTRTADWYIPYSSMSSIY
jgi:hypothetical protein